MPSSCSFFAFEATYISTYCLKFLILMRSPLRSTLIPLTHPARSYTRRLTTASKSASDVSIPNRLGSGLNVISVHSLQPVLEVSFAFPTCLMFLVHVCV